MIDHDKMRLDVARRDNAILRRENGRLRRFNLRFALALSAMNIVFVVVMVVPWW